MLAESVAGESKCLDVLDAGCGTGLCGPLVAPHARRLVGVDLSERMLARARARNIYDELVKRELTAIRASLPRHSMIVSVDTLVDPGPLEEVVAASADALRPGGRLVFTVEKLSGASADAGYAIRSHGRYGHSASTLERVLSGANLRPEIVPAELRLEAGEPVHGLVVQAEKPALCLSHGHARLQQLTHR